MSNVSLAQPPSTLPSIMPGHKRGPWSSTEDHYLVSLVNAHGAHSWVRISNAIQTRSPKQCRERFHQNLKPNLNHEPITAEEGVLIEQMVNEMGKRWAEIARRLRGRSDNAVKNWWNGGMNRRRRSNNPRRAAIEMRVPSAEQQPPQPVIQNPQHHHQHYPQHTHQHHLVQQAHPLHLPPPPSHQPQYFGMPGPMYHTAAPQSMPAPGSFLRPHGHMETPLPSPSAYSHMSAEGAPPSLISDSSSVSTRSPHSTLSPIELPPLSGARTERRTSAPHAAHPGVPAGYGVVHGDAEYAPHPQHVDKYAPRASPPESYLPQHHPYQQLHQPQAPPLTQTYMLPPTSQHRPPMSALMAPQEYAAQAPMHRPLPPPPTNLLPSQPVQLPGISALPAPNAAESHGAAPIESESARLHTPAPLSAAAISPTAEDSPRDKMSLSNLTH